MTWTAPTGPTRLAAPSFRTWTPSPGQSDAIHFMTTVSRIVFLMADPGWGKTSTALHAFVDLQSRASGRAPRMLVVAPLRVCQLQWRQEAAGWDGTRHLRFSLLHGPKKDAALQEDADVYLINYDGLPWLAKKFPRGFPFDVVCCDESTKIKNASAERSKLLRKMTAATPHKWAMTGTPTPNGYEDLFGQVLWLDGGAALGRFITHFRQTYFDKGFDRFTWNLQKGADARIQERLKPYVWRGEFTDLPPLRTIPIWIDLEPKVRKAYDDFEAKLVMETDDPLTPITAVNAGALQSKLSQLANGAVYVGDEGKFIHVHDQKLDALEDLVEQMAGQPLLVAYEFRHDLARLQARFGKDVPYLGSGISGKRAEQIQDDWNAGKIPLLFAHPASVGHGLNLQRGGACHLCWFSATWDLELWEQFIRRLWRQGTSAARVVNHILAVRDSIDELKMARVGDKTVVQARFLQRFSQHPALHVADGISTMETEMTAPLGAPAGAPNGWGAPQTAMPAGAPPAGGGWGAPQPAAPAPALAPAGGGWGAPPATAPGFTPQQQEIQNKIAPAQPAPAAGGWGQPATAPTPAEQQTAANHQQFFNQQAQQAIAGAPLSQEAADATGGVIATAPPSNAPAEKPKRTSRGTRNTEARTVSDAAVADSNMDDAAPVDGSGVYMNVSFSGDPLKVRAAMLAFLGD